MVMPSKNRKVKRIGENMIKVGVILEIESKNWRSSINELMKS